MKRRLNRQEWGLDLWNGRWGFVSAVQQREGKQGGTQWLGSHVQSQHFPFFILWSIGWNFAQISIRINNHHMHYFQTDIVHTPCLCFSHNILPRSAHIVRKCHCLCSSTQMSLSSEVVAIVHLDFELRDAALQLKELNLAVQPMAPVEKNKCLLLLFWKTQSGLWVRRRKVMQWAPQMMFAFLSSLEQQMTLHGYHYGSATVFVPAAHLNQFTHLR